MDVRFFLDYKSHRNHTANSKTRQGPQRRRAGARSMQETSMNRPGIRRRASALGSLTSTEPEHEPVSLG
jgi:hypothetical protein